MALGTEDRKAQLLLYIQYIFILFLNFFQCTSINSYCMFLGKFVLTVAAMLFLRPTVFQPRTLS